MTVAELIVKVTGDVGDATSKLGQVGRSVDATASQAEAAARRTQAAMNQIGNAMLVGGGAVAAGLVVAARSAGALDQSLRNVNSIAQLSEGQLAKLKQSVMAMAQDSSVVQGPKELAESLYDIYSSGFSGQKALDILKVSAQGATAGMTDTATASRVLMAVLNSGIPGIHSAREAMDVLFQEVNLGVNTFPQLASAIGDVLPTAKAAGVTLQEVGAALAVMTRRGISVNEATTALNQLLAHVLKPSRDAGKVMHELGIGYGEAELKARGLTGWLKEVSDKTKGHHDALNRIMPEIRGWKALLTLTDGAGKQYTEMLKGMQHATDGVGATAKAQAQQLKGAEMQWRMLAKQFEIIKDLVGEVLLPAFLKIGHAVADMLRSFQTLPKGTQEVIVKVGAAFAGLMVGGGITLRVLAGIASIRGALLGLGAAGMTGAGGAAGAAGLARFLGPGIQLGGMAAAMKAGLDLGRGASNWIGDKLGLPKAEARPAPSWWPSWVPRGLDPYLLAGETYRMPANPTPGLSGRPRTGPGFDALRVAPKVDLAGLTQEAEAKLQALDDALAQLGIRAGTITSGKRSSSTIHSAHNTGQAIDFVAGGDMAALAAKLRAMGFRAGYEVKGQHNANGSTATGNHIHVTLGEGHIAGAKDAVRSMGGGPLYPEAAYDPALRGGSGRTKKTPAEREAIRFQELLAGTNGSIRDLKAGGDKSGFEKLKADFPLTDPAKLQTLFNAQQTRDAMTAQRAAAKKAQEEQIRDTLRLKEALSDAKVELTAASGKTDTYAQVMARLNLTTKSLTPEMRKLVGEIVKIDQQTEKMRLFRQQMVDLAQNTKGVFTNAFMSLNQGFKGFFGSILQGFSQMLRQMAAEYLASSLVRALFGSAGGGKGGSGLIGAFVGSLFGGGKASGGSVSGGRSYLVGESGPELVTMGGNGHVTPNHRLRGMGGHTFVFNVQTPSPEAFRHSMGQMFQDAHRHTSRMAHRNG